MNGAKVIRTSTFLTMKKIRDWKLQHQVLFMLLLTILFTTGTIVFQSYRMSKEGMRKNTYMHLLSAQQDKKLSILNYLHHVKDQVVTFSEGFTAIMAAENFDFNFDRLKEEAASIPASELEAMKLELRDYYEKEFLLRYHEHSGDSLSLEGLLPTDPATIYLQYHYIAHNSFPTGQKDELYQAMDGSRYSHKHERFHGVFRNYLQRFGYYDIFLVNLEGYIVYSVYKEVDYATNLEWGPYAKTNIGKVYKNAKVLSEREAIALADYDFYPPSYGAPAAFIASPIFKGQEKIGVLIFQMPAERINSIMTSNYAWEKSGMGQTGEIYLAGKDGGMRSISRGLYERPEEYFQTMYAYGYDSAVVAKVKSLNTTILAQPIKKSHIKAAHTAENGVVVANNYLGEQVVSFRSNLNFEGLDWQIISDIRYDEAMQEVTSLRNRLIYWSAALLLLAFVVSGFIAKNFVSPLKEITEVLRKLALGVSMRLEAGEGFGKAEIGEIRRAVADLASNQEQVKAFSIQIGQGNLAATFRPRSDQDEMGKALLKMRDQLKKLKDAEQQQSWISQNMATINELIRDSNGIKAMADGICPIIAEAVGVQQVWLFISKAGHSAQGEGAVLNLAASYAWGKRKYMQKELMPGEGLVGQAFIEQIPTYLETVPEGYTQINSGLGETAPGFVGILPLVSEDVSVGVLEVAAFEPLAQYKLDFLERVSQTLASAVIAGQHFEANQAISDGAKNREALLEEQEERLLRTNEELMMAKETFDKKEAEYLAAIRSLEEQLNQKV